MGDQTAPQLKIKTWTLKANKDADPTTYEQHAMVDGVLVEVRVLTEEEARAELSPPASGE